MVVGKKNLNIIGQQNQILVVILWFMASTW
jgi:hypothetical protein